MPPPTPLLTADLVTELKDVDSDDMEPAKPLAREMSLPWYHEVSAR